jgi:hypothetical protein
MRRQGTDGTALVATELSEGDCLRGGDMKRMLPDEVLKRASRCDKGLICQHDGWRPCGTVVRRVGGGPLQRAGEIVEMRSENGERPACVYHVPFGEGSFCICPARVEIHRRYGI